MPDSDLLSFGRYPNDQLAGPLEQIAQYLPMLSSGLSMISPMLGNLTGMGSQVFAPGGVQRSNPALAMMEAQSQAAIGMSGLRESAGNTFRSAYPQLFGPKSRLSDIAIQAGLEYFHKPDLYAEYQAATLARAGVGYQAQDFEKFKGAYAAMGMGSESAIKGMEKDVGKRQTNINTVFDRVAGMGFSDARGTALHERGTMAAMLYRSQSASFGGSEDSLAGLPGKIAELTRSFSDLARVMGTDMQTAVEGLSATMKMDAVAAFSGNPGALSRMVYMQQEVTRATGVSQRSIAEMTGFAGDTLMRYGPARSTMGAPMAGVLSGFFATPVDAYGIDQGTFRGIQATLTAGTMGSEYSKQLSGLYVAMREKNPDLTHDQFMSMVHEQSAGGNRGIAHLAKEFGVAGDVGTFSRLGHLREAEELRYQHEGFGVFTRGTQVEKMLGTVMNIAGSIEGITEDEMANMAEGLRSGKDINELIGDTWARGMFMHAMDNNAGIFGMEHGRQVTQTIAAQRKGEQLAAVASVRARLAQEMEGLAGPGGIGGLSEFLAQKEGGRGYTFGQVAASFMGAASFEDMAEILGGEDVANKSAFTEEAKEKLDRMSGLFRDEKHGAKLTSHFQAAIADIGKLPEEERRAALKRMTNTLMEEGMTAERAINTVRSYDEEDKKGRKEAIQAGRFEASLVDDAKIVENLTGATYLGGYVPGIQGMALGFTETVDRGWGFASDAFMGGLDIFTGGEGFGKRQDERGKARTAEMEAAYEAEREKMVDETVAKHGLGTRNAKAKYMAIMKHMGGSREDQEKLLKQLGKFDVASGTFENWHSADISKEKREEILKTAKEMGYKSSHEQDATERLFDAFLNFIADLRAGTFSIKTKED